MAKLSELMVRKQSTLAGDGSADPSPSLGAKIEAETDDDMVDAEDAGVGTRLGEECEALRNLLVEAGSKLNELAETKQSFFNIVDPADRALRMLEQEKTRNISLGRRLRQLRAGHAALQARFDEIEKQTEALADEKDRLALELEQAQRSMRELRGANDELTNDVAVARAMAANLEHQVADLTARAKGLSEDIQRVRSQAVEAESRADGLETELAAARESLAILQGENQSLQTSLGQAAGEVSHLSHRNGEMETALTAATAHIQQLQTALSGTERERNRLLAEVNELSERQRNAQSRVNAQTEAVQARAAMAEKLLANTRQLLAARTEESRASDRQAMDAKRGRDAAEAKLREVEALLKAQESHIRELERSRTVLAERNASLVNSLKSRESQLAQADDEKLTAADQMVRLENDMKMSELTFEKRIEDLLSMLDQERLERQVVEGALDATRSERAHLQHELYKLRTAIRRGKAQEEAEAPKETEAPRDEAAERSADAA